MKNPCQQKNSPATSDSRPGNRIFRLRKPGLFLLAADRFLQGLAGREPGDLRSLDLDLLACLRIASHPGFPVAHAERAESRQGDLVALLQRLSDRGYESV